MNHNSNYSSLISHMQYVLTLQGHHQVSIIIQILQKSMNFYNFFKNFIQVKNVIFILTANFVATYNFTEVFL